MNQGGVKVQYDESGSLEVANMTETANKSKRGEGDGRKMTFFFTKNDEFTKICFKPVVWQKY